MKKLTAVLLIVTLSFALSCAAQADTRLFTDSLGREIAVPQEITRIAVTGPMAQFIVFAIAPDMLVGVSSAWDDCALPFIAEEYVDLPVLGQLYGGKGDTNLEALLAAAPQVVIDIGEPKGNVGEDLDALSAQTGIPFVHISAQISSMEAPYAALGELLGREEEGQMLGLYCQDLYARMTALANRVNKARMLYITGDKGLNVIAQNSYHSEIIDLMGDNLAVVDSPSSRGTGNEVDMEQILIWNPDVILFTQDSIFDSVGSDPLWQSVNAIKNDRYYEIPVGPYNWMGMPPSVQRLLGMLWMGQILYPQDIDYDFYEEVTQYFNLFYHCDITTEQIDTLTARSVGKLH